MIIRHLKPSWAQAITIGALLKDISKIELFKIIAAFVVGVFMTASYTEIVARYTPSVYSQRPPDEIGIYIDGLQATVHLVQTMTRDSCEGGLVIRRLYTLWPDNLRPKGLSKDDPMDIAWFQEHDIPWMRKGKHDYYIHLNLFGPVDKTKKWLFEYERYENCSFLDALMPNKPTGSRSIPTIFLPEHHAEITETP